MKKPTEKKKTSPVIWLAIIAAAVAVFVLTAPQDAPKKTTTTKAAAKKKAAESLFTDADFKAKFDPVNIAPKNAFMPVVMKTVVGGGNSNVPNGLPSEFTGGETGWQYTGTAEVNGRIQAVVENQAAGQGDFLSIGQTWKKARVIGITESSLTLKSVTGQEITVKMQEQLSNAPTVAKGFSPVAVDGGGLQGQIGPVTLRPENNPPVTVASEGEGNAN